MNSDERDRGGRVVFPGRAEVGGAASARQQQPGFLERKFVEEFNELIGEGEGELALDLLIKNLPRLAASRLHRKEKLNHLFFMSSILQNHASGKHGFKKLLRKAQAVDEHVLGLNPPADSVFLDLGCGVHDPIALATYYFLNGFRRAVACDIQPPRNAMYSAHSMYEILANIALFPGKYLRSGSDRNHFDKRFLELPAEDFEAGWFETALGKLAGMVDLRTCSLLDLDVADGELGLVVSFAVLEHVDDLGAVMEWLYRKSRPGAVQYHFIDIADHRSYPPGSPYDPWSFLTEETAPKGMNRLRKSEFLRAIGEVGLDVVAIRAQEGNIPDATQRNFLPRWRQMSEDDQRTIKLNVTLRRPA